MSDHYDYGYCELCDAYHDEGFKKAHPKQEPQQPTLEELDEVIWKKFR